MSRRLRFINRLVARPLAEFLLFLAIAVASTLPLVHVADSHIPIGVERSATVPLLNLWTLAWNVDRIEHGYQDYWNAPVFHPARGVLAFSEPLTAAGWIAWPLWHVLGSPLLVYNSLVILFLALNGWFTCRLLTQIHLAWPASLAGGAMTCLLPLIHWQIGVFQLLGLWGAIWTLGALVAFRRRPGIGRALHLAAAFACTHLLCSYYGLFLAVLLVCSAPVLCYRRFRELRFWLWGFVAVVASALALAPVVIPQAMVTRHRQVTIPAKWFFDLSVLPSHYRRTPGPQLVRLPGPVHNSDATPWALSPGTCKMAFACVGLVLGIRTRRRRHLTLFFATMLGTAVLLGMGPRLSVLGFSPHALLTEYVPGFDRARNLFRFAYFAQLMIVLLATTGIHELFVRAKRYLNARLRHRRIHPALNPALSRHWTQRIVVSGLLVVSTIVAGEAWPPSRKFYKPPVCESGSEESNAAWVRWLRDESQPDTVLAFFPLTIAPQAPDNLRTAEWMYFQIWHRRPMVNGYSGFIPRETQSLHLQLTGFPSLQGISALRDAGVTLCVFDQSVTGSMDPDALREIGLSRVFDDPKAKVQIWKIPENERLKPAVQQ